MTQCSGCSRKVSPEEAQVSLCKVWHKCCFRCCECGCDLDADFARVHKGEIYCHSCFKILQKYSNSQEDGNAKIEDVNCEPCYCTSQMCCKLSGCYSDECCACKRKKNLCKNGHNIPRELANYFNRNPIDDRKRTPARCCKERIIEHFPYTTYNNYHQKNQPKFLSASPSRSSSCLERAAKSLGVRKKTTDSCESLDRTRKQCSNNVQFCREVPTNYVNKIRGDLDKKHQFIGCALCRRCGHKVYAAEIILSSYGAYHDNCFSCYCCLRPLDMKIVEEHCGEIFCRRCYKKYFGYNYGFRNRIF